MKTPQLSRKEEKHRDYYKEENKTLRKKILKLENYIKGMRDAVYYLGGSGR